MNSYNFTEEVRQSLARAREEAQRLAHEYVGTEHMLLGITVVRDTVGAGLLVDSGVDLDAMRRYIVDRIRPGAAPAAPRGPDLPYTSRAKKALELAMTEARALNASYVGTEHLLLGLIAEEKGIGAQVLEHFGVTSDVVRNWIRGEPMSRFAVRIDEQSDRSIYEQIIAQVQEGVATGALHAGNRLPTVRRLADDLDIAPGTVARAYGELERLGVVVTEGARGTRIAARRSPTIPDSERPQTLVGLLRPAAIASFHLGASADEVRAALEHAMRDIFTDQRTA